jgi:hypothetical protein
MCIAVTAVLLMIAAALLAYGSAKRQKRVFILGVSVLLLAVCFFLACDPPAWVRQ